MKISILGMKHLKHRRWKKGFKGGCTVRIDELCEAAEKGESVSVTVGLACKDSIALKELSALVGKHRNATVGEISDLLDDMKWWLCSIGAAKAQEDHENIKKEVVR